MKKMYTAIFVLLIVLQILLPVTGLSEAPSDMTKSCNIVVSQGKAKSLLSTNIKEYWYNKQAGATVTVQAPGAEDIGGLYIRWYQEPKGYTIDAYGHDDNLLSQKTDDDYYIGIVNFFPMEPGVSRIVLTMAEPEQKISTLRVSTGDVPFGTLQNWNKPVEKADIMVISTHQDDELLYFGGTIPYYNTVRGMNTLVMYMADCGRSRREEALNGLWVMGLRDYPVFLNMKDKQVKSIDSGLELWGGEDRIIRTLVEQIRKFRPEVIVTHDLKGEYGHNQHRITARLSQKAVDAAADPSQYAESASAYGAWQVKKLYLHLYKENGITMDWKIAYPELDGSTPSKVAERGYDQHASQHKYYTYRDGGKYDNAKFGLAFTVVGDDVEKNDFFENVPLQ